MPTPTDESSLHDLPATISLNLCADRSFASGDTHPTVSTIGRQPFRIHHALAQELLNEARVDVLDR
nr:hypothetical protein [Chloroflexota bacterium]